MNDIDLRLLSVDKIICDNIQQFDISKRELLSQNILSQLRNLVEAICVKTYSIHNPVTNYEYDTIKNAINFIYQGKKDVRFLKDFHQFLQISVSHYAPSFQSAERLMLKYYEYLLKTKAYVKKELNLDILKNINDFPIKVSPELMRFYKQIASLIDNIDSDSKYGRRYYITKKKPFFVNSKVYYEITLTLANDEVTKFDRIIAFTDYSIPSNYSIIASLIRKNIFIEDKGMPIYIITRWKISIRPCELRNFSKIFSIYYKPSSKSNDYIFLMNYLTEKETTLLDLILDSNYENIKKEAIKHSSKITFFNTLDAAKNIISNNLSGINITKYFLYTLNNKIIKNQIDSEKNSNLSNLALKYGCIPFETMPFCTSLIIHNPKTYNLLECISTDGREHELFAAYVQNNLSNNSLYVKLENSNYIEIDKLIYEYNKNLYYKHSGRKLIRYNNFVFFKEYEDSLVEIIIKLKELANNGIQNYESFVNTFIENSNIDSSEKVAILKNLFKANKVALVYGAAGTGKSTLLNYIAEMFNNVNKVFLANTNPAVDNLKRKITSKKSKFSTIASYLSNDTPLCDILFIDECSTVSNFDILNVLKKSNAKAIVLSGDIYQIESINFGNWFKFAKSLLPPKCINELITQFRSKDKNLQLLWNSARNLDDNLLEMIEYCNCSRNMDETIFSVENESDSIILCLNYDGLYGVNSINQFLQEGNHNNGCRWGPFVYKIGDPILFIENKRFNHLLYNNLKGRIINFEIVSDTEVNFTILIDKVFTEFDIAEYDLKLQKCSEPNKSIISFSVFSDFNTDDDSTKIDSVIPFQVAYAISIHKAQGLEYDNVKIVINDEIEEEITHNIFYTAITRARKSLTIYWTPETENKIIRNMKEKNNSPDLALIKRKRTF